MIRTFGQHKSAIAVVFIFCVLAATLFIAAWVTMVPETPKTLRPNEISNYQGEDLSLIDDFRENSIRGPQFIEKANYRLNVTGLVDTPRSYSYKEVLDRQKYTKVVTLHCVEGWSVKILWEGILLKDILNEIGLKQEAKVVILRAFDGYSTSLPIEYIIENDILLAYKMNGLELPPERGFPFELVAESQAGYKWIKWVTEIELSDDVNYRGYWESRGFRNDASL